MGLMKALSVDLIIDILKETAKCSKKEWEQAWGFEGYDFEIFGGFKRFRFLGHNGHILQLTWKVFSLMFDLPELRLPNKKAVEVQ